MATLTIQIDDAIKSEARNVLDEIGYTMTSVIRTYLKQIITSRNIPFRPCPPADSGELVLPEHLNAVYAEVEEDIRLNRNLTPPLDKNELRAYLRGL